MKGEWYLRLITIDRTICTYIMGHETSRDGSRSTCDMYIWQIRDIGKSVTVFKHSYDHMILFVTSLRHRRRRWEAIIRCPKCVSNQLPRSTHDSGVSLATNTYRYIITRQGSSYQYTPELSDTFLTMLVEAWKEMSVYCFVTMRCRRKLSNGALPFHEVSTTINPLAIILVVCLEKSASIRATNVLFTKCQSFFNKK